MYVTVTNEKYFILLIQVKHENILAFNFYLRSMAYGNKSVKYSTEQYNNWTTIVSFNEWRYFIKNRMTFTDS